MIEPLENEQPQVTGIPQLLERLYWVNDVISVVLSAIRLGSDAINALEETAKYL